MLFVFRCDHVVFESLALFWFTGHALLAAVGGFAVLIVGDKFCPLPGFAIVVDCKIVALVNLLTIGAVF